MIHTPFRLPPFFFNLMQFVSYRSASMYLVRASSSGHNFVGWSVTIRWYYWSVNLTGKFVYSFRFFISNCTHPQVSTCRCTTSEHVDKKSWLPYIHAGETHYETRSKNKLNRVVTRKSGLRAAKCNLPWGEWAVEMRCAHK